ncbi:MAG: ATP synthase F1 subunit delta [Ignavibacteriaceae bacterium]|jgi:F-type H+-transporting ATPase subunit delta|nr:MAG: ATP synthase F1 subunit delta [Chlorobiota bacterium]KXK03219.1 MAG: F0F1 ATP synthase subunit delta [Chlorobi bacterium OLB4]MBV6399676.1 ATP synthase subunit delta [Ignavibacteria bacterium]MCC6885668.1 ATP synthase F1 subunit delta [Ignavibacteriales bacterium]MCE7953832.1 ATP synthase F1 subunit delta [Chlorobi bacterium CHB7]MDL1887766.1 ATP synthase F1 subunit delta [Ignavibacteria bacterium CHB1]MEB2330388.1 ATP synthase F1 subunit delta [Ignavibacteriaceae bacterium]OQY76879.
MVNSKIARRYSTALLEEADRQSLTDVIVKDAAVVIKAINDSRELQLFFQSPVIDKDKKLSIVTEIFKGKINQLSFSLISLMVSRKREAETKNVFEDFLELRDERNGIAKAEVVTAVELTEEEKKDIKLKIDHYSKLNSLPTFKVDKSVIGGFKIKIKDTILDASIKRQLELLLKKFKEGGVSLN